MSRSKRSPLSCSEKAIFRYFVSMSSNFMGRLSVLSGKSAFGLGNRVGVILQSRVVLPFGNRHDAMHIPCLEKFKHIQIVNFSLVWVKAGKRLFEDATGGRRAANCLSKRQ